MPDQKTTLEAIVSDLSAQVASLTTKLASVNVDKMNEDVSAAETLRSLAAIDKLNGKLTYDVTLNNINETFAQARRQQEEMFNLRMREAEATLRYNNAKWQQELRHADIATENQWIDGADPVDVEAIDNVIDGK